MTSHFTWQGIVSVAEGLSVSTVAVLLSALLAFLRTTCFRYPLRIIVYEVSACSLISCACSLGKYISISSDTQIIVGIFIGITGTRRLRSIFVSFLQWKFRK